MAKHPGGRPSKYKPEFCQSLVEHMSKGLSYESFAGEVGVCDDTLREWEKKHLEFSVSKKTGRIKQRAFYEKLGIKAAMGLISGFNSTAYIWLTKNMLGWRDKSDIEVHGKLTLADLVLQSQKKEEPS